MKIPKTTLEPGITPGSLRSGEEPQMRPFEKKPRIPPFGCPLDKTSLIMIKSLRSALRGNVTLLLLSAVVPATAALWTPALADIGSKSVAGWVEHAVLLPKGLEVRAKLDTGARTSSLNAVDPVFFSRDSTRWVRFNVTSHAGRSSTLEQPIVRTSKIKRHFGRRQSRPVVRLDICVGHIHKKVEVNLVDRSGLNYQLLIGRNFLSGDIVVDAARTYVLAPTCTASAQ